MEQAATSSMFDAALAVLEVLRVDLHEWRQSADVQEAVQRGAARRDDQAAHPASLEHPAPRFQFRPLATAPATCVVFSARQLRRHSCCSAHGGQGTTSRDGKAGHTAAKPEAVRPPHTQATAKAPAVAAPRRHYSPSPTAATPAAAPCLRLSSAAAQKLYADMAERGRASLHTAPYVDALWRRRAGAPEDAELRRAVRDYLYRMHILSSLDMGACTVAGGTTAAADAFGDAVLNGTALCQLVDSLLHDGGQQARRVDAVPCRCPRTVEEVRVNYAAALAALRAAPTSAQALVPPAAWTLLPEDVLLHALPTALLRLFLHLISTYLPSPEELPAWRRCMTWQPPADTAAFTAVSPAEMAAAEDACCTFLHSRGVLPDPVFYRLPGPECLLSSAVAAPFMASWKTYVSRAEAPTCLLVPSIWPYLCNGVLLVLLARSIGGGGSMEERVDGPASVGRFFANPRTVSCCMANIATAFRCFQAASTFSSSLPFFTAESAAAVLGGDRVHIVSLLLHLRDVLAGKESCISALQRGCLGGAKAGDTTWRTPERDPSSSSSALLTRTPATTLTAAAAARSGAAPRSPSSSSSASTLRRQTPATVAKGMTRRFSPTSKPTASSPLSPVPSVHLNPAADRERGRGAAAMLPKWEGREEEVDVLKWLRRRLEPSFCYTAADETFTVDSRHLTLSAPCWIFSDGVFLAHLIRRLERCRCDALDCVQPTTKKAAKLFNVRRCLDFLRSSAGVLSDVALLDEALVGGHAEGVVAVLRALRSHYGAARSLAGRREERGSLLPAPVV